MALRGVPSLCEHTDAPGLFTRTRLTNARLLPPRHINRKRRRQQRRGIRFRRGLRLYPNIDTGISRFRWLWTERRAGGLGCLAAGRATNPRRTFFCLRSRKLRSSRRLLSDEGVQPHGPARHAREHACSLSMHVVHALIRTSCLAASRRARGGVATRGRPLL